MKFIDTNKIRKDIENEYIQNGHASEEIYDLLLEDKRYPRDILITITGYDLVNHKILGLLGDKPCEIMIAVTEKNQNLAPDKVYAAKNENNLAIEKLDDNVAVDMPINSSLILINSITKKSHDANSILSIIATQALKVQPVSERTFDDIFTTTYTQPSQNTTASSLSDSIDKFRKNSTNEPSTAHKPKN